MHRRWWCLLSVLTIAAACGSDKSPPPAGGSTGHNAPSGGHSGGEAPFGAGAPAAGAGGSTDVDAGGAAQAGASGVSLIGQIAGAPMLPAAGGASSVAPARCDAAAQWGAPVAVAGVSTPDADERLLSMTHDQLSMVFSRGDALYVADRADPDGSFDEPLEVTLPLGYGYEQGLALSADGLRLVLVADEGRGFAELLRPARGDAFGAEASSERFGYVNANASQFGSLSSPVLSQNGKSFFYTLNLGGDSAVYRARGSAFDQLSMQDHSALGASEGQPKLALSVASDERTLFVLNEAQGRVEGVWSAGPAAAFSEVVALPDLQSAFSDQDCGRLYGTLERDGSLDVVVETPQ